MTSTETLRGEVLRWQREPKPDTGWHVIEVLDADGARHLVTGCALPRPGAHVELSGAWEVSPRFGRQFHARTVVASNPALSADGVARWLVERVPGIGPARAASMLARHGGDAARLWAALQAGEVAAADGVTAQMLADAREALAAEGTAARYQALLYGWGLTQRQIVRVQKHWSLDEATKLLHANPYLLADHIDGFGFKRADAVATKLGIAKFDQVRVHAALLHYIDQAANEGHVFADNAIVRAIARDTQLSYARVLDGIVYLANAGRLVVDARARVYLPEYYDAERAAAADLRVRFAGFTGRASSDWLDVSDVRVVDAADGGADPWQAAAIALLTDTTCPIGFVTGGPGTGKTTVIKRAVELLLARGVGVSLAAPTGKAAKRMTEATGRRAGTLHSMLQFRPRPNTQCEVCRTQEPGDVDLGGVAVREDRVIIVDEASMVDVRLWAALAERVAAGACLRFIGDAHQLPPVGAGQPFRDALDVAPSDAVVRLRTVYRAKGAWVKAAAPLMLQGVVPSLDPAPGLRFVSVEAADQVANAVRAVYAGDLNDEHFVASAALATGHMPVIVPQRTGSAGANALNQALHEVFNPTPAEPGPTVPLEDGTELRAGSWVMVLKNDAKRGVCNGDTAVVTLVESDGWVTLTVDGSDGPAVRYARAEARDQLRLAYASTVHKCVAPDTLVQTPAGSMRIDELPALGSIGTAEGARAYHGLVRNAPARALRVTTEGGYEVTVTPEHGLMVFRDGQYQRVEAADVVCGDWLRLSMRPGTDARLPPSLPPWPECLDVRALRYEVPAVMTADLAEFLGLMVADGTVFSRGFRLVKRHRDVVDRFVELCTACFGRIPQRVQVTGADGAEFCSVGLATWLTAIGGLSPHAKAVPRVVLRSPLAMQARFLRGLFEDGTVNMRGDVADHIEWSTCQAEMARVVMVMLLRFGIVCTRVARRDQHMLYIYGADAARFAERIGFVSAFKQSRALTCARSESKRRLVPVERLPIALDRNANNRGYVSRHKAQQLGWSPELDWHHARVTRVEETVSESWCVTVPGHGRFLQNGFDGCNSQGSEYPWAIVVCHSAHKRMLTRRLLYTAITRAKDGVVLVGDRDAVDWAVQNTREIARCTWLKERVTEGVNHGGQ